MCISLQIRVKSAGWSIRLFSKILMATRCCVGRWSPRYTLPKIVGEMEPMIQLSKGFVLFSCSRCNLCMFVNYQQMGNKQMCCQREDQGQQSLFIDCREYSNYKWYKRIQGFENKQYNHTAAQNEYKAHPKLQTIRNQLRIKGTLISDVFHAFRDNPKELFQKSMVRMGHVSSSIIITDSSKSSKLAQSFIQATDMPLDLKTEINSFVNFLAHSISKLYRVEQTLDEIKILLIEELFENQQFYNFVKQQYDQGLTSKTRAYRKHICMFGSKEQKYIKAVEILKRIQDQRSPKEKLETLDMSLKAMQLENLDADGMNDKVYELVVEANIASFVSEIKMIQHFAGEIDAMGRFGYVLTMFMGVVMLLIQNT